MTAELFMMGVSVAMTTKRGRKDGEKFWRTTVKATVLHEWTMQWNVIANKSRFVREAIAEKMEREFSQMLIKKDEIGNYTVSGHNRSFPNAHPELVFCDEPIAFAKANQGHGELYEVESMPLYFLNWDDFPELHNQKIFLIYLG